MSQTNPKNAAISPSVLDLGLGDRLQSELEDQELQRRRKLGQLSGALSTSYGNNNMIGPATLAMFGPPGTS